ncbi:MAG: metal-sulfur cluster assembly factor [Dehalococcoidia bacterium]|nr:metal-sulfur cluster assembly factor [Dehalococcoidia bacterium]
MTTAEVAAALANVYDPELGIDIVSLGLVYDIGICDRELRVGIAMTTPDCPMAGAIFGMVQGMLSVEFPAAELDIQLANDPPWNIHMADEAALRWLGVPAR